MDALVEAQQIRVEFGPLVAVHDATFELRGGELLGIVGPNGAGKTTLLRVLAGLQAPTRGRALILGKPVLGEHEVVRHHVGFAPDTPPAYNDVTVEQFLQFIAGAYDMDRGEAGERVDFWLEQLWLGDKRDVQIKDLSRGMRQRVTLARTFLPRPHAIMLDEPLSGLDPAGRIQLRRVLSMLREQGCAMAVSSHILTDLEEVATHIAIMEHGQIIRWTKTTDLHHEQQSRRRYRLTTVAGYVMSHDVLSAHPGVTDIAGENGAVMFDFDSDDAAAAGLLKMLVQTGVPVTGFVSHRTTLEETYLRAGVKQVD